MKKNFILASLVAILLTVGLFILTGCKENTTSNDIESKTNSIENKPNTQNTTAESIVGYYEAFETVQYGVKYTGDDVKKENITLLVNDDNTASLSWGESSPKLYKIENNQFIALDGDQIGNYTYKNGVLKLEIEGDSDFSISFRK